MNNKIKKYIIFKNKTLKDALNVINKNGQKTCFVLDKSQKLFGSITDGDIRRKIISSGISIKSTKVEKFCNKNPIKVYNHNLTTKKRKFSNKKN